MIKAAGNGQASRNICPAIQSLHLQVRKMSDTPESLLRQAESWFQDFGDQQAIDQFRALSETSQKYRVALAGGVSRGKTRLLNRLLATDIFPESSIPTTTVLTEVSYGPEKTVTFQGPDGEERLPLARDALERFSAEEREADSRGMVRVTWPADFLKPDLVLYDTPGIDDVMAPRASVTYEALENADAALIVVAANAPVSLLEKSFIETYLIGRHLPHMAVVITFLDTIARGEAGQLADFIKRKVAAIDPGIEIWCGEDYGLCSVNGPEAIRKKLAEWDRSGEGGRVKGRLAKCLAVLEGYLGRLQALLDSARADREGREKASIEALEKLDLQKDEWKKLRNDFLASARETSAVLNGMVEKLEAGIMRARETESEEQFRMGLRPALSRGGREIAAVLRERLERDSSRLQAEAGQRFGVNALSLTEPARGFALGFALPDIPEQNSGDVFIVLVNFARMLWKDIAPMLPIPVIFRGKAQELVQNGLDSLARFLGGASSENDIELAISDFFVTLRNQLSRSVNELYMATAEHLREEQSEWLEGQKARLRREQDAGQLNDFLAETARKLQTGQALRQRLGAFLAEA